MSIDGLEDEAGEVFPLEVLGDDAAIGDAETDAGDDAGDEESVTVGFEGDAVDKVPEGDGLVRHLRSLAKEQARQIAELRGQVVPKAEPVIHAPAPGPKPKLADYEWNDDAHEKALDDWYAARDAHAEASAKAKTQQEEFETGLRADFQRYHEGKAALRGVDFDEVEAIVAAALPRDVQIAVVRAAEKPSVLIAALARSPEKLKALAAISDPIKFGAAVARLEGAIKVSTTTRKPAAPERRVAGGGSASPTGASKQLERLRDEAAKTGDFSKVAAYRAGLKRA